MTVLTVSNYRKKICSWYGKKNNVAFTFSSLFDLSVT